MHQAWVEEEEEDTRCLALEGEVGDHNLEALVVDTVYLAMEGAVEDHMLLAEEEGVGVSNLHLMLEEAVQDC